MVTTPVRTIGDRRTLIPIGAALELPRIFLRMCRIAEAHCDLFVPQTHPMRDHHWKPSSPLPRQTVKMCLPQLRQTSEPRRVAADWSRPGPDRIMQLARTIPLRAMPAESNRTTTTESDRTTSAGPVESTPAGPVPPTPASPVQPAAPAQDTPTVPAQSTTTESVDQSHEQNQDAVTDQQDPSTESDHHATQNGRPSGSEWQTETTQDQTQSSGIPSRRTRQSLAARLNGQIPIRFFGRDGGTQNPSRYRIIGYHNVRDRYRNAHDDHSSSLEGRTRRVSTRTVPLAIPIGPEQTGLHVHNWVEENDNPELEAQRHQNDESLRKWKESLGIGSGKTIGDPSDPRKCIILSLGLEVEGRSDIIIDLTTPGALEKLKKQPFTIKEGATFRMKARFTVQHQILSGMKYIQVVKRGPLTNKMQEMIGSYSPSTTDKPEYEKKFEPETAPSGMVGRGSYKAVSRFVDDDQQEHLRFEWSFDIKKDW
ncbi:hypothetical protein KVT40_004022 [Elsinoe batatas]|uniref:Rho GDP-dissociation inhibitor n=1 Tax=Elsinoe batatas TaxID=2601811 RepID=A0A8K0L474_9PEZI|nr:hypothetical protein KVT40_004022 [Elsinoe batatas]